MGGCLPSYAADKPGIDSRATQRSKGMRPRSKRFKIGEHEDDEIQAEINKGNTVRIIQDI